MRAARPADARRRRAPSRRRARVASTRFDAFGFDAMQLTELFPLPKRLFNPTTGALELPEFGTNEFVNAVTVLGIALSLVLVAVDLALRQFSADGLFSSGGAQARKRALKRALKTLRGASERVDLRLARREQISPDTVRLTFALPSSEHVLGLPTGQHVGISYVDAEGVRQERPYTPTSSDYDRGVAVFVIKVYKPNEKFPLGGKVSQFLGAMKVGDVASFVGPKGMKTYEGKGVFSVKRLASQGGGFERRRCANVGMIAGGSGITPMLQVSRAMLDDGDNVKISLLFANQTEADILCREEIESDAAKFGPSKFRVAYTLDKPPATNWSHYSGFITKEMIQKTMPPPGKNTQILICGPPPMLKFAVLPALEALGYTKDMFLTW